MLEFAVVATCCRPYLLHLLALINRVWFLMVTWDFEVNMRRHLIADALPISCHAYGNYATCLSEAPFVHALVCTSVFVLLREASWKILLAEVMQHIIQHSSLQGELCHALEELGQLNLRKSIASDSLQIHSSTMKTNVKKNTFFAQVLTKHCLPKRCHVQMGHYVRNKTLLWQSKWGSKCSCVAWSSGFATWCADDSNTWCGMIKTRQTWSHFVLWCC